MKRYIWLFTLIILFTDSYSQDSVFNRINNWLTDKNFSIRKTFDGSKSENKPACLAYQEDHLTSKVFFNIDFGIKLSELELFKETGSSLIFYPKVEWHKSTDPADLKNKVGIGVNFEFLPFRLKAPKIPLSSSNNGLIISPWIQGISSFKKNFISNAYETEITAQVSFLSNYNFLPGCNLRDKKGNFRMRYYPYIGYEYNRQPDLITKGTVEEFSLYFIRFFIEVWIVPETIQIIFNGTYRQIINNKSIIRTWLPIMSPSANLYPGKQQAFSIGYEFTYGYDDESTFQLVQISSIKFNIKI